MRVCVSVCVCARVCVTVSVSHNNTTVGQQVRPFCCLWGHSVGWYTNLIHFARTLNYPSRSLQFRVNTNIIVTFLLASTLCIATQAKLILEITVLARCLTLAPMASTDSLQIWRSWQRASVGQHGGQLACGYCSVSWSIAIVFVPPKIMYNVMCQITFSSKFGIIKENPFCIQKHWCSRNAFVFPNKAGPVRFCCIYTVSRLSFVYVLCLGFVP